MIQSRATAAVVRSLANARARRWEQRVLRLQLEFERLGFHLDPLSGYRLLVQRWGLYRVLDVDEAEQLLRIVRRAR